MKTYTYNEAFNESIKYFNGDEFAASNFVGKYALVDDNGNYYEKTPADMHRRLAKEFARIEAKYPNPMSEEEIYSLMDHFKYIVPQGSPMSGIGNPFKVMSLGNCFVKGTKVFTNSGPKNIEDVEIGDIVPTHKGRFRNVVQLHKNKLNGRKVFDVKCFRTPSFKVTENHALWSISQEQLNWGSKPGWNEVSYLRKGDWVAIPHKAEDSSYSTLIDIFEDVLNGKIFTSKKDTIDYEINITDKLIQLTSVWYKKSKNKISKSHNPVNRFWVIDEDFAFFLGLWYGDGCIFSTDKNRDRVKGITFTFGSHEQELIDFVSCYGQKLFGLVPDINYHNVEIDGSVQVVFYSAAVGIVFSSLFGRGCKGKKLFDGVYNWPKNMVNKLIGGLISSDGTVTKSGDSRVVLSNHNLINQFYSLARINGLPFGISQTEKTARLDLSKGSALLDCVNKSYNDDRINNARIKDESTFGIKEIDGVLFVRLDDKIQIDINDEFVYTLGVEEDHSYCVEGIICQNCFVIESPYDSYGGIMKSDQELAQLMKRRAGVGLDVSNIRPKGMITKNAAKTTDGISVFMERFSNTCREVAQSGRRGAEMQTISVHHPEVVTFAQIKRDKTKVTGANVSIRLSDEFMQAVKDGTEYEQRWPVDSKTPEFSKMVLARDVWKEIIYSAWLRAEPGILYWNKIINNSPSDIYADVNPDFKTSCTNPCFHGDERFLTETGYFKFKSASENNLKQKILTDNRISYSQKLEGEHPENWNIDVSKSCNTVTRDASAPFITKEYSDLLEIEFSNGQTIKCTKDHHFATTDGMIEAQFLTPDHDILVSIPDPKVSIVGKDPETVNEKLSFLAGLITGDGTFCNKVHIDIWGDDRYRLKNKVTSIISSLKEEIDVSSMMTNGWNNRDMSAFYISEDKDRKKIRISSTWLKHVLKFKLGFTKESKFFVPEFIINNARTSLGAYYLAGLFYADGTVTKNINTGLTVRLSQSNKDLLKDVQLLLHANGVLSSIYLRRNERISKFGDKEYNCKTQYELITTHKSWKNYIDNIGFFGHPNKEGILDGFEYKKQKKQPTTNIISIKEIDGDTVYCLKENVSRSLIVNTISARRCGEIPMGIDSCRLLVVNIYNFVKSRFTDNAFFDFSEFAIVVKKAQRLMDDIIDLELEAIQKIINKIETDPEPEDVKQIELNVWKRFYRNCKDGRRTGLGITGLGDALAALGLRYGSAESIKITGEIYRNLAINAYKSSCLMAKERGAFPIFDLELEKGHPFIERIISQDTELETLYREYGRRNVALTTTAPTGTVSTQTQTTSGIEPAFLLMYDRWKKVNPGDENVKVDRVDKVGDSWQKFTIYHHAFKEWMDITNKTEIEQSPYYKATSNDVDWIASVDIQAEAQKWVCHAISKTCNLPKDASEELISEIYMRAWEKGCKGFTVYRDGCRDGVLTVAEQEQEKEKRAALKRPKTLKSESTKIKLGTNDGIKNSYVHVSFFPDTKDPYEVFMNAPIGQDLKDLQILELSSRLTSLALRHGIDLKYIVDQLQKVDGQYMYSIPLTLAKVLEPYVKDGMVEIEEEELNEEDNNLTVSGIKCPGCGKYSYIKEENCGHCLECAYSECS